MNQLVDKNLYIEIEKKKYPAELLTKTSKAHIILRIYNYFLISLNL